MQNQQFIRTLVDGWWIIVTAVLISTGIGLAYSYSLPSVYESTSTFVVNPTIQIGNTYDQLYSIDTLAGRTSLATTYSNILKSRSIIEMAAQAINLSSEELAKHEINAVVLPDSNVILLQVHGPSPVTAANLANAIGGAGLAYIKNLQEIYELRALDLALVDPIPISPNHLIDVSLGVLLVLRRGKAFFGCVKF
jgi:capsular polysaccharide biosynthesis protein